MPRHWQELMSIMKVYFPYDHEGFSFADIMDSPILQHRDDVEEVKLHWYVFDYHYSTVF